MTSFVRSWASTAYGRTTAVAIARTARLRNQTPMALSYRGGASGNEAVLHLLAVLLEQRFHPSAGFIVPNVAGNERRDHLVLLGRDLRTGDSNRLLPLRPDRQADDAAVLGIDHGLLFQDGGIPDAVGGIGISWRDRRATRSFDAKAFPRRLAGHLEFVAVVVRLATQRHQAPVLPDLFAVMREFEESDERHADVQVDLDSHFHLVAARLHVDDVHAHGRLIAIRPEANILRRCDRGPRPQAGDRNESRTGSQADNACDESPARDKHGRSPFPGSPPLCVIPISKWKRPAIGPWSNA